MGSRKSQGNFLYLPQQDILVTSQGFISPDSFFLFPVAVLGRSDAWKQNGFLLARSFLFRENDLSGTKWGAQKVWFRLKRFLWDQMPQAEGFVPRGRVSGTKSSRGRISGHGNEWCNAGSGPIDG